MDKAHFTELFRLYISGECTPEQRNAFFDYLREHGAENELQNLLDQLYSQVKATVPSSSYVSRWGDINMAVPPATGASKVRRMRTFVRSAAAVAAIAVACAAWYFLRPHGHTAPQLAENTAPAQQPVSVLSAATSIRTSDREQKLVVLSDSTRIMLNGATVLRYPDHFDKDKREIYLEGEAYFDVDHAAQWPFIIHTAGGITTTVLGTSFNIKAYPDRTHVIVSVVKGKVKVTRGTKDLSVLNKGQELRLALNSSQLLQRSIAPAQVTSWQHGDIMLTDESLADIIKDLQIFYGTNITLNNPDIANLVLTIGFKKQTSADSALQILCELSDAKYTRTKGGYVVY